MTETIGITWIASYPKSGSTWLRSLIEAYYRNGIVDINRMTEVQSDARLGFYQNVLPAPVDTASPVTQAMVRPAALIHQIAAARALPVFVKTHNANMRVRDCYPLIPDELTTRSIYLVRDPRDVVPSYAKHMGKDLDGAIRSLLSPESRLTTKSFAQSFLGRWDTHYLSWKQKKPLLIRYEDLWDNPVRQLMRLLKFCDVDATVERVEAAVAACSLGKMRSVEQTTGFIEGSPNAPAFFGQGGSASRSELSEDQEMRLVSEFNDTMHELGYLPGRT